MEKRPTKKIGNIVLRVEFTELPVWPGTTHRGKACYGISAEPGKMFFYGYTTQEKAAEVMDKFTTVEQVAVNLTHDGPQQVVS